MTPHSGHETGTKRKCKRDWGIASVLELNIKIHAALADCGQWNTVNSKGQVKRWEATKLWYYFRAIDGRGSGRIDVDVLSAADFFGCQPATIRRWINAGLYLGFFRAKYHRHYHQTTVWLSSLTKVALRQGISDLGAIATIPLERLPSLKFAATEAEALRLQNQSKYHELKKIKKGDRAGKKLIDADGLLSSELGMGALITRQGRFSFIKSNRLPFGGTQKSIAANMGRHPTTIQRRLSDVIRRKHNLDPVAKTQIIAAPLLRENLPAGDDSRPKLKRKFKPGQRIIRTSLGVFRLAPNIYGLPDVELTRSRFTQWRLNRAIERETVQIELQEDWKLSPEHQSHKSAMRSSLVKWQKLKSADNPNLSFKNFAWPEKGGGTH